MNYKVYLIKTIGDCKLSYLGKDSIFSRITRLKQNMSIIKILKPIEKPEEFHVIGFEENSRSVWKFIFQRDYVVSLVEATGFRLKGGEIEKLLARTATDPDHLRGTIIINNPAFQVDMQLHW